MVFFWRTEKWMDLFPPKFQDETPQDASKRFHRQKHRPVNHQFWGVQNVKTGIGEKVIRDTFEARSKIRIFFPPEIASRLTVFEASNLQNFAAMA